MRRFSRPLRVLPLFAISAAVLGLTTAAMAQAQPGNAPQLQRTAPTGQGTVTYQPLQGDQLTQPQVKQQVQPQQTPPQPRVPYVLSPQEQAEINHVLLEWEKKGKTIKNFECSFSRLDYDALTRDPQTNQMKVDGPVDAKGQQLPRAQREGTLKYGNPDKGLFHITEARIYDAKTGKYESKADEREKWVCDGKAIYEFSGLKKQLIERRLPPEMQGKAIADGPLPFLFGSEAATLAKRYWLRLVTPSDVKGQAWIEALPKFQADAQNFRAAILVLDTKDLRPLYLNLINPDSSRMMYTFSKISENSVLANFDVLGGFNPSTPFNWTRVVEDPNKPEMPAVSGPQRGSAGGNVTAPNNGPTAPNANFVPAATGAANPNVNAATRPVGNPR